MDSRVGSKKSRRIHSAKGGCTAVAAMRHTGDLTSLTGPPHQSRKRRTGDALLFGDAGLGGSGQHLRNGPEIAMELLSLWRGQRRGIKRRTRNEGERRV